MQKYLYGAAAALFLLAAPSPAPACDDCKSCDHKKPVTAQAEKKDDKSCHCTKDGGTCKCGEKCTCAHCKEHKGEKKDDTKKS